VAVHFGNRLAVEPLEAGIVHHSKVRNRQNFGSSGNPPPVARAAIVSLGWVKKNCNFR
jgi:hypothetical protein